jgi:metal-responsive CopG/Arc/MetJ family transcriptional regulator
MPRVLKSVVQLRAEGAVAHIAVRLPRIDAEELNEHLRNQRGYPNRSAFIREAIWQKIQTDKARTFRQILADK